MRSWTIVAACGVLALDACYWPGRPISALPALPDLHVEPSARSAPTRNVILVVLDGVRWQDVFYGVDPRLQTDAPETPSLDGPALVPNIFALARRGVGLGAAAAGEGMDRVRGAVYVPSPFISLPSYRTIVTGDEPPMGCENNGSAPCAARETPGAFVWSDVAALGGAVGAISSWPTLHELIEPRESRVDYSFGFERAHNSSFMLRAPFEALREAAERRGHSPSSDRGYRSDAGTIEVALEYVRQRQPRFLFVSLGDADEYGHLSFCCSSRYAEYIASVRQQDRFVGALSALLASMGRYGDETTVVITADHGRNNGFARHVERAEGGEDQTAGRSWIVAAGGGVRAQGLVTNHETYRLNDIAPTIRALLALPHAPVRAPIAELR